MKIRNIFCSVFILTILISSGWNQIYAQQVPVKMIQAFQNGDPEGLSPFFNDRFQLTLLGVDHRISQAQAKEIMREFFRKYPPVSFEVMFTGDKKDSNFAVGKLKTKTEVFRVNLFFKKVGEHYLLHLLEIEKENDI